MMARKGIVEFVGTFFLVLTVGMTVLGVKPDSAVAALAPLAIGSALMVMIYAGGPLSGGHYNPAVTLAVWLRGKCPTADVPGYIISQVLGAVAAAFSVLYLKGNIRVAAASPDVGPALLAEFLFTFALCYVVLNVATSRRAEGNSYFGLAIGFTVLVGAYAVGSISGGAFNPAVAVGVTLMGLSSWANLWIFLAADFAGGLAASVLYNALNLGAEPTTAAPKFETDRFTASGATLAR